MKLKALCITATKPQVKQKISFFAINKKSGTLLVNKLSISLDDDIW